MKKSGSTIIGLVGLPGAGKTTAAKYLEQKGFARVTLSDFIKNEAKKRGVAEFSREVLQDFGNKMREQFGPQVLAEMALKSIRKNDIGMVVIDGIRNLYEAAFLEKGNSFTLVGIMATLKVRYSRLRKWRGRTWTGTYNDFLKQDRREQRLGAKGTGLRVRECLTRAPYKIKNEGTREDLYAAIDQILLKAVNKRGENQK